MASLQDFIVTGSLNINQTTDNTSSVGNIWYDSTVNRVKYSWEGYGAGVWSAGGNLITGRNFSSHGAGTQNSGLAISGYSGRRCTEEYNGTSWGTGGATICSMHGHAGGGTQNQAFLAGGTPTAASGANVEEYDGTSWTAGGTLSTARYDLGGTGTQNDSIVFGGRRSFPNSLTTNVTEEYNGTTWSTGGNLGTGRFSFSGAGTSSNSALAFAGNTSINDAVTVATGTTEEYDGTAWTSGGGMTTNRRNTAGAGTQNLALAMGGTPTGCTEEYNGYNWTSASNMSTPRRTAGGGGTQQEGFVYGGFPTTTSSEEYNQTFGIFKRTL